MAEVSYEYLTFDDKEVIIRRFVGNLTIKEIADSFKYLINEGKITNNCKGIVNDLCLANFNPKMSDFKNLLKVVYATSILRKLKLAAVVLSADRNAFPFIVKLISGLNAQPFKDINDAIDWVLE